MKGGTLRVPLLDLKAQWAQVEGDVRAATDRVWESQRFIMGPEVASLEEEIAAYCDCAHAVGVSSGTDALLCAMMALEIGVNCEVITTPFTFFATAGCISRLGARAVFVDIDPVSYNIDPGRIEAAITDRTRAIIPVHLFGQCAEMDPILEIASGRGIPVIEDAAQAIGSTYRGRKAGSMGTIGCFSFFPSKNLGCAGDGGMCTTNDRVLAEKMSIVRLHGGKPKYYHRFVGANFRLDAMQAAVVRAKLPRLEGWHRCRRENAAAYDRLLADAPVEAPVIAEHNLTIFNQYVIRSKDRDSLREHLTRAGIGTEVYYPVPLHVQECFADLGYGRGAFSHSERAAEEVLALPIYPELTHEQVRYVAETVCCFAPSKSVP